MASLGRIARLLARAAAWCALVYLLCLLLGSVLLRVVTAAAAGVLRIVDRPPVLTALTSRGDHVVIATHLSGLEQPLATWDAANLPIFIVATIGLALAAPAASGGRRMQTLLAAVVASNVTMVATTALQLQVAAANEARASLGLLLHDGREEAWLGFANEGIGVAMLLVPAAVFAFAYVRFLGDRAAGRGATPVGPSARVVTDLQSRRRVPVAATVAGVAAIVLLGLAALGAAPIDPRPGLVRVVQLNPGAPQAYLALSSYDALADLRRRRAPP